MHYRSLQKKNCRFISVKFRTFPFLFFFIFTGFINSYAQTYNRGVGVYPGNTKEDFSPTMKIDSIHYRNLALYRPAYQSSSFDYNLTSQLVTDGIIDRPVSYTHLRAHETDS